ncbi:KilAC domain (KilAC) [Fructobacillus cardui]|uniref:phage antirepressor n=1 Tax=Fructobacillus cardui TaxID=2893170 RepID=UPI002DAE43BC|nr:KilAC domain (KilAC) [Fructobacillus cardui]
MNEVKAFNFESNEVRTVLIDNEPWFVGKDVAETLGYSDTQAMTRRLDDDEKDTYTDVTSGQGRRISIISEPGIYNAISGSKKESAKRFRKWVNHEVLPSIRKHSAYLTDEKAAALITNRDNTLSDLLIQAGEQLKAKDLQISEMKPKALFADAVDASDNSILIGQLAKELKQNGIDIGQNRLFAWLREHDYLISRGEQRNLPTQKSFDLKIMETKVTTINQANGKIKTNSTPKVTGRRPNLLYQQIFAGTDGVNDTERKEVKRRWKIIDKELSIKQFLNSSSMS